MRAVVEVQYGCARGGIPSVAQFRRWSDAALGPSAGKAELVIRIVDEQESATLNWTYRCKQGPTNVLAFPFEVVAAVESRHLGDVVICAPVVEREAHEQGKRPLEHWAHMVVHGVLHLRGYDHQSEVQARDMETLERKILARLGVSDPYQT